MRVSVKIRYSLKKHILAMIPTHNRQMKVLNMKKRCKKHLLSTVFSARYTSTYKEAVMWVMMIIM